MIFLYYLVLILLTIYSYALIDPNLTLINHPLWNEFRNQIVQLGYYHRDVSWALYLSLITLLFLLNYFLLKNHKNFRPLKIALVTGGILLFSYPFLSHDFFNYLFDAKIFTHYHQNPYLHKALDYPNDSWIRFMHWTHRTYPYGPVWIVLTILPSFLALGKFILNFIFFKFLFVLFYVSAVYVLEKNNKKNALFFATHPFIIIEGLVSAHNDLIAVSLGLIAFYLIDKNKNILGRIVFLLSAGIKYLTLPLVIMNKKKNSLFNYLAITVTIGLFLHISLSAEIQPWYFLNLFAFLPLVKKRQFHVQIFLFGLLLSYYPFIRLGVWDQDRETLKHNIIIFFSSVNIALLGLDVLKLKIKR